MELNNPGAVEALNVIPNELGYAPYKSLVPETGLTLDDVCRGAVVVKTRLQDIRLYAATRQRIFLRAGAAFTEVFNNGAPLLETYLWQFVQFGSELVALHPQVTPQVTATDGAAPFAVLGGSPPMAACGARVGDFLVLGNLDGEPIDPRQPQRIRWNGFNRIDLPWVTDPLVQSDYNDMPSEGGAVIAIAGRELGTVFQERSISRMTYVGLPKVFDIQTVEEERGALSVGCVVDIGAQIFFIAEDGFFVWNGTNSTPIGDDKVNRYFFSRLDYMSRGRIVGTVDYENKCIRWAFPTVFSDGLVETIVYSYKDGRFTHAKYEVEFMVPSAELPISIDDLHGDLDTDYTISFDDVSYSGGKGQLAGFDATHTYGAFRGAALEAMIDTAEATAPGGRRVLTTSARPLVDIGAPVVSVQIIRRDQMVGETLSYDTPIVQELNGECAVLSEGRFIRFRTIIPESAVWFHARGIEVWRKPTGRV